MEPNPSSPPLSPPAQPNPPSPPLSPSTIYIREHDELSKANLHNESPPLQYEIRMDALKWRCAQRDHLTVHSFQDFVAASLVDIAKPLWIHPSTSAEDLDKIRRTPALPPIRLMTLTTSDRERRLVDQEEEEHQRRRDKKRARKNSDKPSTHIYFADDDDDDQPGVGGIGGAGGVKAA